MKPIKVSQINQYVKRILQTDPILGNLSVIGEISNLKFHGSGHVYFSLKDETSRINCFFGADRAYPYLDQLEDGMEIIAHGNVTVYEKGGTYSLNVLQLEVQGKGNLTREFENLKNKLRKEGIFDEERKKAIPFFPKTVALITSATGAAIRDMMRTIQNKNHYVDILIYPCLVQGDGAAKQIAAAIDDINLRFPQVDVMILGRGGGSIEELWAFNEEIVARSIDHSCCPIISGVGHETDFTIADFATDMRAATPTAAAEAAVPDIRELSEVLMEIKRQMKQAVKVKLDLCQSRLLSYTPEHLKTETLHKIQRYENQIEERMQEMLSRSKNRIHREELRLNTIKTQVSEMDPCRIMSRGYGMVMKKDHTFIKSIHDTKSQDSIEIRLQDGSLECVVTEILEKER